MKNIFLKSKAFLTRLGFAVAVNFLVLQIAEAAGIVGNGTAASCTETALNTALNSGGVVTFNCGSAPVTITFSTEKVIATNTTIDGGNLISFSGAAMQRLFNLAAYIPFTVKNLSFINGKTVDQGAAINSPFENNLTITHCIFKNNNATKLGEYGGGAVYSGAGTLTVSNSVFSANKASIGGAIRVLNSNLVVSNSTFTGNQANNLGSGGAIYIDGAKKDNGFITISNSTFKTNFAANYGGAIFNSLYNNNKAIIKNSVFSGNKVGGASTGQGAAIWSTGDSALGGGWVSNSNKTTLTISNTTVANNSAGSQAGGIWLGRHPAGTGATISNSTVSGNIAASSGGGGIVLGDVGKLTITNSTIAGNSANGATNLGGGLWISNSGTAVISNTTIANNVAYWQAGGIYGGLNVTLKNTILANNVAKNGGNSWNVYHNCITTMTNGGNNLQFSSVANAPCANGIVIVDPKLDVLKNNGGVRQTMALLPGSPASRAGANCPKTDQRGVARPLPVGTACDIGAFEAAF